MEKLKHLSFIVLLFAVFFISSLSAHAELFNRGTDILGNRLIYDSDLNITWYDYTMSYDIWQNQMDWASGLEVNFGGTIYDDWRLPTSLNQDGSGPCSGYNCTGSEMGHLYFTELENVGYPTAGYGLSNTSDFQHLQPNYYWSGTEYVGYTDFAWYFGAGFGRQGGVNMDSTSFAIAVRPSDVSAVVPEPISSILFITGGTLLAGRRYIKRQKKA